MDSITTQAVKNILTQKLIKCKTCNNYILGEGAVSSAGIENCPSIVAVKCESCRPTKRHGCVFVCLLCTKCNQLRNKMKCNCDINNTDENDENDDRDESTIANNYADAFDDDGNVNDGSVYNNIGGDCDDSSDDESIRSDSDDSSDDDESLLPPSMSPRADDSDDESIGQYTHDDSGFDGMIGFDDEVEDDGPDPHLIFTPEKGWSNASRDFFTVECMHPGYGKKMIICKALTDCKDPKTFDLERISEEQVNYHFHSAELFLKMTVRETDNICTMMQEEKTRYESATFSRKNATRESIRRELSGLLNMSNPSIEKLINDITTGAEHIHMEQSHPKELFRLPDITTANDVRRYYTRRRAKSTSMTNLLPCPEVTIKTSVNGNDHAGIRAIELVNHVLAMCKTVCFYRAGFPQDWDPQNFLGKNSYMSNVMKGDFFREIHQKYSSMAERGEIPAETRIVLVRIWSDAFEAHKIAGNNEYNSVQIYTLRFKADPEDYIVPIRLSFKKKTTSQSYFQSSLR